MAKENVSPKFSFETQPEPISAKAIKEIINTEIVVAGAGPAGVAAAVSAAEKGAKVVLLEKFPRIAAPGGTGAPFMGTKLQKEREAGKMAGSPSVEEGIPLVQEISPPVVGMPGSAPANIIMSHIGQGGPTPTKEGVIKGLWEASGGRADERLIRLWADKSGEVGDWLIDMARASGINVSVGRLTHLFTKRGLQLHLPRTPVGIDSGDEDNGGELVLLNMMANSARQKGVDIRLNTAAVRLIRPGKKGRVTGLIARKGDGSYIQFNASQAVILCTGDYGMDDQMLEKYAPWAKGIPKLMLDTVTGDGHKMGLWAGAAMEESPHCAVLHFNSTNEKPVIHFRPLGMMMYRGNYLYVNKFGERIVDESQFDEFLANIVLRQPGKTFWQVFDVKSLNDTNREDVEKGTKTGSVLKADTIEALAPKFGANPKVFKATVDRYNELVNLGQDLDFGKKSEYMVLTVDKPPFYVCESPPDLLCVMGGFRRNADGQVLDANWKVIPGLYAAGNITGGFWGDTYPMGFLGGISRSHALVFGRLAGLSAASQPSC
jgi:fumarate reductase flavoprotein subunit